MRSAKRPRSGEARPKKTSRKTKAQLLDELEGVRRRILELKGLGEDSEPAEAVKAALSESEERFNDFASSASDWFWEMGPDLRFKRVSEGFEKTTGLPAEAAVGKTRAELGHMDPDDPVWVRHLADLDARRPFRDFEYGLEKEDGRVEYFSTSGKPVFDADGAFQGYRGTSRNITERRESEAALRESEERYRRLVEVSPYGIVVHVDGIYVFANPAAVRTFGAKNADEVVGRPCLDVIHPDFHEVVRERIRTSLDSGRPANPMDQVFVGFDGRIFDVETTATPILYRGQAAILAVFRDITERKRSEEALRASEARTAAARAQLIEAIESMSEGFAWYDADDRLILFNERYRELFAESADLIVEGARFEDIARKSAERGQIAEAVGRVEEWVRERLDAHREPKGTLYHQLGSGRWVQIDERKIPGGGTVGIRTDITRLKDLEGQLLRRERLATVGQLTATVSHEMRNPLGTIRNAVDVIKKLVDQDDDHLRRAIALLDRSQLRLDKVIEDLLNFTRVQELKPSKTEVDAWLGRLLDDYELPPGVNLRRKLNSGARCDLDPDRFDRAIRNVIENACQAMAPEPGDDTGAGEHLLTVATRKSKRGLEVSVADTGSGVAPEVEAKIFEPLYSTKSFGVGLGLPMVRQVAEQHGGGVRITSAQGRGTEVLLWLPLTPS